MLVRFYIATVVTMVFSYMIFVAGCVSSTHDSEDPLIMIQHEETSNVTNVTHTDAEASYAQEESEQVFAEPELPMTSAEYELTRQEYEFILKLHEMGINWAFSERQQSLRASPFPHGYVHENRNQLFIKCPENLVGGLVQIFTENGSIWGESYISMHFFPYREPTYYEFINLQQNGLLSFEEWALFWEFAGNQLGKPEVVSDIFNRADELFANYPFSDSKGNLETVLEGIEGNVDFSIIFSYHPILENYSIIMIELIAGLTESYREIRRNIDW